MTWLYKWYRKIKAAWFCYKYPGKGNSDTYTKYPKDSKFGGRILNLGCGLSVLPDPHVVNLDMFEYPGINKVWDLSKTPLPFESNSFDLIIANHILEHIPDWFECFKELARILKPGGKIDVWLPGDGNETQLGYRDHINVINSCSFYGIGGTIRNHSNLWELKQFEAFGDVRKLRCIQKRQRLFQYWWLQLLPDSLTNWCAVHLRHIVAEVGFLFQKGRE